MASKELVLSRVFLGERGRLSVWNQSLSGSKWASWAALVVMHLPLSDFSMPTSIMEDDPWALVNRATVSIEETVSSIRSNWILESIDYLFPFSSGPFWSSYSTNFEFFLEWSTPWRRLCPSSQLRHWWGFLFVKPNRRTSCKWKWTASDSVHYFYPTKISWRN